jgi:hypothetical protein
MDLRKHYVCTNLSAYLLRKMWTARIEEFKISEEIQRLKVLGGGHNGIQYF